MRRVCDVVLKDGRHVFLRQHVSKIVNANSFVGLAMQKVQHTSGKYP
jgi:hypothetical protein